MVAFCSAVVLIFLALRLNPRAALNRAVAWLAFCYALWTLGDAVVISAQNLNSVVFFTNMSAVGYIYGMAAYLTLSLVFTGASPRVMLLLSVPVYILATVEVLRSFTGDWVLSGFRPGPWGNVGIPTANRAWAYVDLALRLVIFTIASVAYLRSRAASHSRRFRSIALIMLVALLLTAVLQVFSVKVVWQLWGLPEPSVIVGMIGIGLDFYLIERYRFLSLDHPRIEKEALGAIQDAVMLFDPRLTVIRANQSAQLAMGLKPRKFIGQELTSLFPESEPIKQSWQAVVAGKEKEIQSRCSFQGGEFVMTLSPIFDEFEDLIGGMAIVHKQGGLDEALAAYGITAREKSIVLMLMQGITNKQIAGTLFIAPNTVKNHIANIYQKTGAGTRVELFRLILEGSPASK